MIFINFWIFELFILLNFWIFEFKICWIFEFLNLKFVKFLNFKIFEFWNFEIVNFCMAEKFDKREEGCVNPCPGQWLSANKCDTCHRSCAACYGPYASQCLVCNNNFTLNVETHSCSKGNGLCISFYAFIVSFVWKHVIV